MEGNEVNMAKKDSDAPRYDTWAACHREHIEKGMRVSISTKKDDGRFLINGVVEKILTPPEITFLEYGIHVLISDGTRGYVKKIIRELDEQVLKQMIQVGEDSHLEFKETFKVDVTTKKELKCLRDEVVKEIAAFMNADGGTLIIGVNDSQHIVGLDLDYKFINLVRENQVKKTKLTEEIRDYVRQKLQDETLETKYSVSVIRVDGKDLCVIAVISSQIPAFVDQKIFYTRCNQSKQISGVRQNFFIRTGPQAQCLGARKGFRFWTDQHLTGYRGIQ